jgi:CIC family chloride channel protein
MRVLVACGAAAGISATFNAPLAGGAGVLFTRVLYAIEDLCDSIWRGPEWLRPAVGGVALGLVLLLLPEMYGVGYPVLGNAILGGYAVGFLVVLLLGKMIATSLTIGIGGSGGVFAPSLFIGAMLGAAFGETAHVLFPAVAGPVGVYGLIGMGAVFAGAARAPITGVIILFELTGEYTIILPLMLAIVLATGLSHRLSPDTIYTLKLRRRGVDLGLPAETVGGHPVRRVGDVMTAVPTPVLSTATLVEVAAALSATSFGVLPVVDPDGTHLGVVSARGVSDALADGRHDAAAATLVTEMPTTVAVDDPLSSLAESLSRNGIDAAPVVDDEDAVVGWVDYRALLRAESGRPATVSATT